MRPFVLQLEQVDNSSSRFFFLAKLNNFVQQLTKLPSPQLIFKATKIEERLHHTERITRGVVLQHDGGNCIIFIWRSDKKAVKRQQADVWRGG